MTPSNWALGAQNAPEKYATHVQNGHLRDFNRFACQQIKKSLLTSQHRFLRLMGGPDHFATSFRCLLRLIFEISTNYYQTQPNL